MAEKSLLFVESTENLSFLENVLSVESTVVGSSNGAESSGRTSYVCFILGGAIIIYFLDKIRLNFYKLYGNGFVELRSALFTYLLILRASAYGFASKNMS